MKWVPDLGTYPEFFQLEKKLKKVNTVVANLIKYLYSHGQHEIILTHSTALGAMFCFVSFSCYLAQSAESKRISHKSQPAAIKFLDHKPYSVILQSAARNPAVDKRSKIESLSNCIKSSRDMNATCQALPKLNFFAAVMHPLTSLSSYPGSGHPWVWILTSSLSGEQFYLLAIL